MVDYGTDLDWAADLSKTAGTVSGTKLLGQAAFHRLSTPRGTALDCPDDGLDLREYLSLPMTAADLAAVPGEVSQELRKDERFQDADVTVTKLVDGFKLAIVITPAEGPDFELTLGVSAAAVKLLGITGGG